MSAAESHPLPLGLSLFLIAMLGSLYFGLLSSAPGRRTWFTVLLTAIFGALGTVSYALSFYSALGWRIQVVVLQASDLMLIVLISGVCLAQAGLLPRVVRRRRRSAPLATVAARPRLRAALACAPWVLFASWLLATALLMLRPVPALEAYGPAPPRFLVAVLLTALPEALYAGLAGWLFLKASGRRGAPSSTLRVKNLALSVGVVSWGLLAVNAAALAAAQVTLADGAREAFAEATRAAEKLLTVGGLSAFGVALTLRYVPKVDEAIVQKVYPGLLRLQDRMEIRRWRLMNSGKLRRVVKASYYASEASDLLDLREDDLSKCLNTLQLAAIMADKSEPGHAITPDMAKELHALQRSVISGGDHASQLGWPKDLAGSSRLETVTSAPLHDALEASLALTSPVRDEARCGTDRFAAAHWYHLAAVAAADAGIVQPPNVVCTDASPSGLSYRRVLNAYQAAKDSATRGVVR